MPNAAQEVRSLGPPFSCRVQARPWHQVLLDGWGEKTKVVYWRNTPWTAFDSPPQQRASVAAVKCAVCALLLHAGAVLGAHGLRCPGLRSQPGLRLQQQRGFQVWRDAFMTLLLPWLRACQAWHSPAGRRAAPSSQAAGGKQHDGD